MKFRFCGDLDCPDWVLAEIATISKISSIKAKQLTVLITQSLLLNKTTNVELEKLEKLATDSKLELNDVKACVSLIEFVLISSSKHSVNSDILSSELQQLGLPKEHSTSICKVYEDNQTKLEEKLRQSSLKINDLLNCAWRIDYVFGSSHLQKVNQPIAHVKLDIKSVKSNRIETHVISLDELKLKLLIHELKEIETLMDSTADANLNEN